MQLEFALNKDIFLVWYDVGTANKILSETEDIYMCVFLLLVFVNNSNEYTHLLANVVFPLLKVMIILMFNIDSILDSLMHRNDKIYLYCQQIWCGLWRSSVCVLLVCIVYMLCIDFVQSIDYFISTILSDCKINSPKNNSADFIVASRINQGFVWAIHNAVFCRLRVWVFIK